MEEKILEQVIVSMIARLLKYRQGEIHEPFITWVMKRPFRAIIFLLCLVNISLILVNVGIWLIAISQKLFVAADFTAFYTAYYMIRVGEGTHIYDTTLQSQLQRLFMHGFEFEGGFNPFPYPPYLAIILSPISFLPMSGAFYLWTIIQVGLLVWVLFILNRILLHWDLYERLILIVTVLAFWPLADTFLLGQFSLLLLLCFLQMYVNMKNNKLIQSGVWMFLLSIKPQLALIPAIITLTRRYWRIALAAVGIGIFFFIGSLLLVGLKTWVAYFQYLFTYTSYFDKFSASPAIQYTIRGVLTNILGNSQADRINSITIAIFLFAIFIIWLLWRNDVHQDSSKFPLYISFTIALSVFLSFHLNAHDALILVLPAALFFDYLRGRDYPRQAFILLMLISPSIFIFTAFSNFSLFGIFRLPTIIIVSMIIWMGIYMVKDRQSTTPLT